MDEEPLLGWIVATTQQAAGGGEYVALLDYGADLIITTLDHTLGDGVTECLAPQCPFDPVPSGPSAKSTECLATKCPMVPECLVTQSLSLFIFLYFLRFY